MYCTFYGFEASWSYFLLYERTLAMALFNLERVITTFDGPCLPGEEDDLQITLNSAD